MPQRQWKFNTSGKLISKIEVQLAKFFYNLEKNYETTMIKKTKKKRRNYLVDKEKIEIYIIHKAHEKGDVEWTIVQ